MPECQQTDTGMSSICTNTDLFFNVDAEKRAKFNDVFQNKILKEYARIINIPVQLRKDFDEFIKEFLNWIKYEGAEENYEEVLTWPMPAGRNKNCFAIRVKMSYKFWTWFREKGYKNLLLYNQQNGFDMRIIQEKGMRSKERQNLCLFVRNKVKELCINAGRRPINMKIKKDELILENVGHFDPVVLAKRLSLDVSEWKGLSLEFLMDERMQKEGITSAIGPLCLPGLENPNINEEFHVRKRLNENVLEDVPTKKSKNDFKTGNGKNSA